MQKLKMLFIILATTIFPIINYAEDNLYQYQWELDETPEGQETVTPVAPLEFIFLDEQIPIADNSSALILQQDYSVYLSSDWTPKASTQLLKTFQSIPQKKNIKNRLDFPQLPTSFWEISYQQIHNDIDISYHGNETHLTVAADALTYATPLLAENENVRGRYFSKRLHRAVLRYVTQNGNDKHTIKRIFKECYELSIDIPDYTELTQHTTAEDANSFQKFTPEEIIDLLTALEEFPTGMLKTPGLKYLVRRKDGTLHPITPTALGAAWTNAGYIEFMEIGFKNQPSDTIHRLILHEKAHFLWAHLFDEQLKEDWIKLGGWYQVGTEWATTEETSFVSQYAHGHNPDEDMAESISFYIRRPDKLRSHAPTKYEFIQKRIMHGTQYISQIRQDLTFKVYNLYPDYVYPGRIISINAQVIGAPTEDKEITITIKLHHENDLDLATHATINLMHITDNRKTRWIRLGPIDTNGNRVAKSHILRGTITLSKFEANGYWIPYASSTYDGINTRYNSTVNFSLKLYINNPLADFTSPEYIPNSLQLSLTEEFSKEGRKYQMLNIKFNITDTNDFQNAWPKFLKEGKFIRTGLPHTKVSNYTTNEITSYVLFPDYAEGGIFSVWKILLFDKYGNESTIYFSHIPEKLPEYAVVAQEKSPTIEIITGEVDKTPPVLDINNITISAEPTNPQAPNGETEVFITYLAKDDISGFAWNRIYLRDPHGKLHQYTDMYNNHKNFPYFSGDPTIYKEYKAKILLPVGSVPGTWGLAEMLIDDWAGNYQRYDFTEIIRFEIIENPEKYDLNNDGSINILDLVILANALGETNKKFDLNDDGTINIQDLIILANNMEK